MNRKRTFILGSIVLLGFLIWYFFLKPYDYIVKFSVPTSPGTVMTKAEAIQKWPEFGVQTGVKTLNKVNFSTLEQRVVVDNYDLNLQWFFEGINDSLTEVKIGIKDTKNSLYNRLMIPLTDTDFEEKIRFKFVDFKKGIHRLKENTFHSHIKSQDKNPEFFIVYTQIKSASKEKALNMMRNDYTLRYYIDTVLHQTVKTPIVEVTHWDIDTDSITYNYGFPIDPHDTLPDSNQFFYKKIEPKPSMRALFNGNYMNSHHSWYQMYDKAVRDNIPLAGSILEVYHNNPYNGGNELEWETDVYMPLKE